MCNVHMWSNFTSTISIARRTMLGISCIGVTSSENTPRDDVVTDGTKELGLSLKHARRG